VTHDSRKATGAEAPREDGPALLEMMIRQRMRETIETVVEEELVAALGAARSDPGRARAARISPWDARADAHDKRGANGDHDAAGTVADPCGDDGVAARGGAALSAADRAGR
jgi:hypothetical protein